MNCCVVGCTNRYTSCPAGTTFHRFSTRPCFIGQRQKWIAAVRRKTHDGRNWEPSRHSKICSAHFVGGVPSKDASSPSYVPTIFPDEYRKRSVLAEDKLGRYERIKKRRTATPAVANLAHFAVLQAAPLRATMDSPASSPLMEEPEDTDENNESEQLQGVEVSTQTLETPQAHSKGVLTIACTLFADACEASTQVAFFAAEQPATADASVAALCLDDHQPKGFYGYQSLVDKENDALRDLTGVTVTVFLALLRLMPQVRGERYLDLAVGSKLLLCLMKMKHGLTFSALGVLFGIHRTSASRIFYAILDVLYVSTQGWIKWFSRDVVQATMPPSFRLNYTNCRVIVDCSEVRIEKPGKVADRVNCWSNYKSDFTLKFLVGITPSGYITYISDVFGGRSSDTYILANSGLINLLEPGDMVMADKGFPHVKCDLESKDVTLVMPPFAKANQQFTKAEMQETYKVASHRIHVERCIQRIKSFAILNERLTPELKCHIDKIVHLCSVLANLQGPVIKTV
ncbi:uncharacterized protein LOC119401307 [Rhipicephalus sanguineus]|uniref:uncharacterized protein LOC119401307 n=1 Tax=Rhipicephalus sanguineus TaxID=34632 RepID=UPI001893E158|nr:uncharacterized protein LOC119401307 [Rhipicephalus sanguineus]